MVALLKVDTIKEATSATNNITLDSSGNVTIGNNLTVTGTTTQTGATTFSAAVSFPDGSVSAPSITNTGDTNTGIYFPAANQVGIATDGVAALTADSSQNVSVTNTLVMGSSFKRNILINGNMAVWQRGTSQTTTGYGCVDRWSNTCSGTVTFSQDTSIPTGIPAQYSLKWVTSASSSYGQTYQAIEQLNVIPLRGQTVTISAYAKTSGYGAGSQILRAFYSNSSDALSTVTAGTVLGSTTVTGTSLTSWTRILLTVNIPSDAVGLVVGFLPDTVQGSGVTVWLTGVQLEVGSVATPYERQIYSDQLAQCFRYYWTIGSGASSWMGAAYFYSSSQINMPVVFPVQMRTAPTVSVSNASAYFKADTPTGQTMNTLALFQPTIYGGLLYSNALSASGTAGYGTGLFTNNASAYCALSAEL